MQRKVSWTDTFWDPVTGCWGSHRQVCSSYCYAAFWARHLFRESHLDNPHVAPGCDPSDPFAIRFWPERLEEPLKLVQPSRILVCSLGELFSGWVPSAWIAHVMQIVRQCPQHIFQMVTREPQNVHWWNPLPDNVWFGAAAPNRDMAETAVHALSEVEARLKFLCLSPLLGDIDGATLQGIDWLVVGGFKGRNRAKPHPKWVNHILARADALGLPVFVEEGVGWPDKRQEYPVQSIGSPKA